MIKTGLEKEVKNLTKKYGWKIAPLRTIGYQEWLAYFNKKISKKEVAENIILHTVQFSKRQMTWFKKDKKISWARDEKQAGKLVEKFLK